MGGTVSWQPNPIDLQFSPQALRSTPTTRVSILLNWKRVAKPLREAPGTSGRLPVRDGFMCAQGTDRHSVSLFCIQFCFGSKSNEKSRFHTRYCMVDVTNPKEELPKYCQSHFLLDVETNSDGLPSRDGLHPNSDGLQPSRWPPT